MTQSSINKEAAAKVILSSKILTSIEIDLKGECRFNCSFCHLTNVNALDNLNVNKLSLNEITGLIAQASELGAQKVILFDDPVKQHPDTEEIIKFINEKKMHVKPFSADLSCNPSGNHGSGNGDYSLIKCLKHKDSCFVTVDGLVYPCVGMPLSIGDIRKTTLKKILRDSEVIANLKNHEAMIKGPCRQCDKFSNCYGCRARAFALTGDYLASDPQCPENCEKLDKITYLPMSVEQLLPQKQGMCVVSKLLKVGERYARVESVFSSKSPFIKKDKSLEEFAYMEVMAQSAGVMDGFEKFDTDQADPEGYLIGGQKINIYAKTYVGDRLIIDIYKTTKFGNFGILTAKIFFKDVLIAEGEIKIYQIDGTKS